MNVRAQVSMLFHLDKCIGCHTCSIACKNLWTDRKGAEYMWWNNVETRPGAGYPVQWENQTYFNGGWKYKRGKLDLRLYSKTGGLLKLFFNPDLPSLEDYYEPFTFRYSDLFDAPEGDDQPVARPISMITGKPIEIQGGPNWDDDLGGSPIYAHNDLNWKDVPDAVRQQMEAVERVTIAYLPRICNHCLNPGCVAACPSGAIYKRAEDGVVLVNENRCRAWRMCVAACPYKKVYYNWSTGKSEKCLLCFPRIETGQAPACAHSCVGRIRYMGVLLYDADRIPGSAMVPDEQLVESQRSIILDPFDPDVIASAKERGVPDSWINTAQRSPVYQFVKVWQIALPLHPEFRTIPMMFYIPPLSPVVSEFESGYNRLDLRSDSADEIHQTFELFDRLESTRLPLAYLASLLAGGNEPLLKEVMRKLLAVRIYMRHKTVDNLVDEASLKILQEAGLTPGQAEGIYRLTTRPTVEERFVLPPYHREMAVESREDPQVHKGDTGFGFVRPPVRGA
ncbi:MAG: nitrate reductase subunit beta [Omnitrophica WOR_2 bacterium]